MTSTPLSPRELLEYLARGLVGQPDSVAVDAVDEADGSVVLELSAARDDYGTLIGRGGRTAGALRTVLKLATIDSGRRYFIDIVD